MGIEPTNDHRGRHHGEPPRSGQAGVRTPARAAVHPDQGGHHSNNPTDQVGIVPGVEDPHEEKHGINKCIIK